MGGDGVLRGKQLAIGARHAPDAEVKARHLIDRCARISTCPGERLGKPLEGTFGIPTPTTSTSCGSCHGHAGAIVTDNLKDFSTPTSPPTSRCSGPGQFAFKPVAVDPGLAPLRRARDQQAHGRPRSALTPPQTSPTWTPVWDARNADGPCAAALH